MIAVTILLYWIKGLGISETAVESSLTSLKENGYIEIVEAKKYWLLGKCLVTKIGSAKFIHFDI